VPPPRTPEFRVITASLAHHHETERLLANYLRPVDACIQAVYRLLAGTARPEISQIRTFVLDRAGSVWAVSLPLGRDDYPIASLVPIG